MRWYIKVPFDRSEPERYGEAEFLRLATEEAVNKMRHTGVSGVLRLVRKEADHYLFVVHARSIERVVR